ncbi:MAG: hypothetical protein ACOYOA_13515 [Saprospiraceae bacterium]
MKHAGKIVLYGFLLWLTVFIISFLIFPLKESNPPFFETLISISLTASAIFYGHIYFKKEVLTTKKCVSTGLFWAMINIVIDLPLFLLDSPMKMAFTDYLTDIGLTYMIIPLVLLVYAYRRDNK